ncbi:MAG: sensor histidine kinase [Spirochaetota bacterium]|nr:sensor histidine kinase [Spirochaetota bacterium]
MNFNNLWFRIKRMWRLPILYEDSYEALRLLKGNLLISSIGVLLVAASLYRETSELFRIQWEIIIPIISLLFVVYLIILKVYRSGGFDRPFFQVMDIIGKFMAILGVCVIIYFSQDPRAAWWVPYFILIVLISQLSEFYWFFFASFIVLPSVMSYLFILDKSLKLSTFHKSFPLFIAFVSPLLYYYQSRLKRHELSIKENNLKLVNELNNMRITLERERISRELHDTLGASLTGNILYSEIARDELSKSPEKAKEKLIEIEKLSRDALIKMREAVYSILEDKELLEDFAHYLQMRAHELLKIKNIELDYHCSPKLASKVSPNGKYQVYRIVGEWLTNILKHSEATNCRLELCLEKSMIVVYLSDNGIGFDLDELSGTGSGIGNIRHRVNEIGGEISIKSKPGHGSELEFRFPA